MRIMTLLLVLSYSVSAMAVSLTDYKPFKFEVLFTNPVCNTYKYRTPLTNNAGEEVFAKTKNAYCKSSDSARNARRDDSPHNRLIEWIRDENTREIFLAYLSFSKRSIAEEICQAIKNRNVKVTLIYDKRNSEDETRMATAKYLSRCKPSSRFENQNFPVVLMGGHQGGIGYAHNKLFFVNPDNDGEVKLAFSSGNMSSGTVTHHENWNFITTNSKSYFAQVHRCLREGMLKHGDSSRNFSGYIESCRNKIQTEEESDVKVFFIPGNGSRAIQTIQRAAKSAKTIEVAAHRFSYGSIINVMNQALDADKTVRLVVDDDIYWTGVYRRGMGRNSTGEYNKVRQLIRRGMDVRYIETYADDVFEPTSLQLHHNKFLIFTSNNGGSVFAGAGNLTSAAFNNNFENFYYISIPSVYKAFKKQYDHYWTNLGRSYEEMPTELVLP